MKIKEVIQCIENFAPLEFQEDYDNSGLLLGNDSEEIAGILLTIDVTDEVVDEAVSLGCNLIVSHHPLIFQSLKKINAGNPVGNIIIRCITENIA